jgi:hypothetical protein
MKGTFLIFAMLSFVTSKNNCQTLKDGVYLVKHTSKNGAADYRLTIVGGNCNIQVSDTIKVDGKLKWIDNCSLKFEPSVPIKQDTTELARKLYRSFGEPFIEIKTTNGDSTFFRTTWTGNLHITINEGYFLKVK